MNMNMNKMLGVFWVAFALIGAVFFLLVVAIGNANDKPTPAGCYSTNIDDLAGRCPPVDDAPPSATQVVLARLVVGCTGASLFFYLVLGWRQKRGGYLTGPAQWSRGHR